MVGFHVLRGIFVILCAFWGGGGWLFFKVSRVFQLEVIRYFFILFYFIFCVSTVHWSFFFVSGVCWTFFVVTRALWSFF